MTISNNRDGNRIVENGRLVYFKQNATQEYWEDHWYKEITPDSYLPFKNGNLYEFKKMFLNHLPKNGRILEAGCGMAQYVLALNALGYDCYGLDYAYHALRRANKAVGYLPLACGDITTLGVADNIFSAVISLGVVEHRREGPEVFLKEMHRVLSPGGVMLISVPCFNPLRVWRSKRGAYQDNVTGMEFYQYAFTSAEFCKYLNQAEFDVERIYTYSHQKALRQELHWLKKLPEWMNKLIMRISKYIPYVNSQFGHMLMVVARKRV